MMLTMRLPALRATAGIAAALSVLALAFACVSAQAASYTVWSCRGPDGKPLGTQAWSAGDERGAVADTCADGGALQAHLSSSGEDAGHERGFRFALPAGASISGYRIHLYAATAKAFYEQALQAGLDHDAALSFGDVDAGCPGAGCVFGTPDDPLAEANLAKAGELDSRGLVAGVRCGGWLGCRVPEIGDALLQGGPDVLAELRLFRSEVDVRDDRPPVLGTPAGDLVGGATLTGDSASVTFGAGDEGGGVASLALLVDGDEVARRDAGGACAKPFTDPLPCPSSLDATLTASLTALADGAHSAALRATDAAGNVTTGEPIAFTVGTAEPEPPAPPGQPPAGPPQTVVVERIVTVPVAPQPVTIDGVRERVDISREGAVVSGLVKDAAGAPLAGAKVLVRSRPFGVRRARSRAERTLTTGADGRFSMPAGERSRLLILDVDDSAHRAREQVEVELLHRLRVVAVVGDRNLRNGQRMTLRADITGAGGGAEDKVVLVQAVVGGRWATVQSLTADDEGRAIWRYRFRGTTRPAIYRFRLRVERAGDVWPWPTTNSPVLRVKVRP
jgi:hypothetical protein